MLSEIFTVPYALPLMDMMCYSMHYVCSLLNSLLEVCVCVLFFA